jgi:transcriptional regulator with XRE-family HTH domain
MQLNIGENIKRFRKERNITQEELSEILGVSFQSVSRWENGTCYPDLELLPTISNFFGITVDRLLGVNKVIEQENVKKILDEFQKAISVGNIDKCIEIARQGVAEYPNNYELLNTLMYALFLSGDEDGNIPDWKENMLKYDAEITALGERIVKYCPDENIRLEAMSRLAFNHCIMGRKKTGRAIYEQLPPQDFCKESQMWWGLEEDERLPFVRDKIRKGYFALESGIYLLSRYKLLPDDELVRVLEK